MDIGDNQFCRAVHQIQRITLGNHNVILHLIQAHIGQSCFCGQSIHVHGNRIFFIDDSFYQRILEYEMSFKE